MVNNAGIYKAVGVASSTNSLREVFDTNVVGLCAATREAVKSMEESMIDGHIVQISSMAAHIRPNLGIHGAYCASKTSVNILAEALRVELVEKNSKIKISVSRRT